MRFSPVYNPTQMRRGDVFAAWQYPRQAFNNLIDPVLNIDWFEMNGPTFPAHPHAGFSAVTYLFTESPGGFINRDSEGEQHDIRPGGLHWSRAARGLVHEETPVAGAGPVHGLQIFINLPAARQRDAPYGYPVLGSEVALANGAGWTRRTAVNGTALGAVIDALPAPVRIEEIRLAAGVKYSAEIPKSWGGILIALDGQIRLNGQDIIETRGAVGFASDDDGAIEIVAGSKGARIAIVTGGQLHQPVFAHGPLMLASAEALEQAQRHVATLRLKPLDA